MDAAAVLKLLEELNQTEVISRYNSSSEQEQKEFITQFNFLEQTCPGGIKDYCKRAKVLLEDSKNNVNPFSDYTPEVPLGFNVKVGDDQFFELDKLGFDQLKNTVFVLVAGGLGERLGYPDIKIGLQSELVTLRPFIEVYVDYLLAFEDRIKNKEKVDENFFIPLCIMTSGDTHDKTVKLLKKHKNFGLRQDQIVIVKQEKCPALIDNDCHLALKKNKLEIETKPHGHGDIHFLLYQSGLVDKWLSLGKKYFVLFQDTNVLAFNCIPSALGASVKLSLDINSICVPRRPKDAVGAICKLKKSDGSFITNNVEYNQLDSLLKAKYNKDGDVPNKDGLSDFPGNINVLIFKLDTYKKALDKTKGVIPEFVNPKYTDETRTKFKSPTRLECLMQDFPKLLTDGENVGFTSFDRWFCFSACKNKLEDACNKIKKKETPEGAFSVEQDIFICNERILKDVLGKLEIFGNEPVNELNLEGVSIKFEPKIIIYPSFAATVSELKEKLSKMKQKIKLTANSTLILKNDVYIDEGVELDGYLVIDINQKEYLNVKNDDKIIYVELKPGEGQIYEQIRGYWVKKTKTNLHVKNTKFGYYDDVKREYVITNPQTPWPWINYLGNEDYFGLISNTCGGYDFYKDAKFRRITRYRYNGVPMDAGGRYFYIKDGDTIWNPGWKPCKTILDKYECRHGLNYSIITGGKNGVEAEVLFFIPLKTHAEVQKLKLTNYTPFEKNLKLFSFVEWCLWNASTDMENFQRNFSTGEVEIENNVIYHKTEYKERRNHFAYYSVNAPIQGYDSDRETFIGLYNGFDEPQAVVAGKPGNSFAHGWSPIASHYLEVNLKPGESKEFVFVLGYVENDQKEKWESKGVINKKKAKECIAKFDNSEKVNAAFEELRAYWSNLLSIYNVSSGDEKLDRMVNIWNQYQCMITFCFSRSASFFESGIGRGMGFRDSNQDLVGFVHQIPSRARERIIDIASTQFPDGGCYHQYQPLTKRGNNDIGGGFNDDPLWLIFGVVAYIKESGDFDILNEKVPFDNKPGSEVTLFEHLTVSFDHVIKNLGPHMLPLIGRADWNDCLNLNCFSWDPNESFQTTENKTEGTKAESLMIAGQFVICGKDYAELCRQLGKEDEAKRAEGLVNKMVEAVEKHGWDGEWYLRAYDYYGKKVGSNENKEGKIFIESQGWCTMAGIGLKEGLVKKALDSVKKYLDFEHGIVLNYPCFTEYVVEYGEISSYPKGYKENGAVFSHNNPWVIIGETVLGRGDYAWDYYKKICPAYIEEKNSLLHKVEPYVYCQMTAGKEAFRPGEAKNSWLTGTAAWNWYAISQFILGIKPDYKGLEIDPCIPAEWTGYTVNRKFRGADYKIVVVNNGVMKGVKKLVVNGKEVSGNVVPMQPKGSKNVVEVTMG